MGLSISPIFKGVYMRKLATAAISFSVAVFAANYIIEPEKLLAVAIVVLFFGVALSAFCRKWLRPAVTAMIFFAVGLVVFSIHYNNTVVKAKLYAGQTCMVTARVLDYPQIYEDYCRLDVKITEGYLPTFKALLYDNDKQLVLAEPGDTVILFAKVNTADKIYGKEYSNYHSKGFYLKLSSKSDIQLIKGSFDVFNMPKQLSHWLTERISKVFPADTEVFMRSLLLGDKSDFYDDDGMYASMSRAGLMHIVAVSGMHISFLVGLLHFVFGSGRRAALICILTVWFFAFVTGAGPSVLRASFMYTTMLLAPVLRRENDAVTSMSTILALILCINPFAALSVSLQLSFAAMAGILLFTGRIYKGISEYIGKPMKFAMIRYIGASVSCSLAVMVFTLPLTAIHFGYISLLSPLTNLISLWAVSLCFSMGWLSCVFAAIPGLGEFAAVLCSFLAKYILFVAELVSANHLAALYMQTRGAWLWLSLSYTLVLILLVFRKASFGSVVLSLTVSVLALNFMMDSNETYHRENEVLTALNVGQGQCIISLTEKSSVVFDCGNIQTIDDAGQMAAAYLYSHGRESLDVLVLSHLHADHANGAVMLMELIPVKLLVIPETYDDADDLYAGIVACAENNGTKVLRVGNSTGFELGDISLEFYKGGFRDTENERCIITRLINDDFEFLAMSDATAEMERRLVYEHDMSGVDVFSVSHHGSAYSSDPRFLERLGAKTAVISTGYNFYGHPSQETLDALKTYGYNVKRTDIDGDISIEIG